MNIISFMSRGGGGGEYTPLFLSELQAFRIKDIMNILLKVTNILFEITNISFDVTNILFEKRTFCLK